jgi:hypothetical protein
LSDRVTCAISCRGQGAGEPSLEEFVVDEVGIAIQVHVAERASHFVNVYAVRRVGADIELVRHAVAVGIEALGTLDCGAASTVAFCGTSFVPLSLAAVRIAGAHVLAAAGAAVVTARRAVRFATGACAGRACGSSCSGV